MNSFLKLVIVLAIAHLLAALGFVTWLFASGRVDGERLARVREIFSTTIAEEKRTRAEEETKASAAAADADLVRRLRELPLASAERTDTDSRAGDRIELGLRNFEDKTRRLRDELRKDGESLDQRIQSFEKRKSDWEKSIAADKQRVTDEQFRKAVKNLESLPPKQAREVVLELVRTNRMDTAVAYIDAMSSAKASNLLKSFKSEEETKVATELLERLRMLGLESEARAERTNGAKSADQPAESARTEANASGGGSGSRAPAANRSLELPGGSGRADAGSRANADDQ
ncbi:MAG: hypothetical protein RLZZ116_2494 [Planctomycetota bacterium]|jgi:hypothetical protein